MLQLQQETQAGIKGLETQLQQVVSSVAKIEEKVFPPTPPPTEG